MKRHIFALLALAMLVSMTGCGSAPEGTEPVSTTAPTESAETTEATMPQIDTYDKLLTAIQNQRSAELAADLTLPESIVLNGAMLDGFDHTLTGPVYDESKTQTHNTLTVQNGLVKNVTLKGDYRCVGDTKELPQNGTVQLDNVTVDGPNYALNFGYGNHTQMLIANDSKFYGWSSYTGVRNASFNNCTFGWDSTGGNGNLRPYVDTVLSGCVFESKTEEDGTLVPFNISLRDTISGITITLEDCYAGDVLITQENVESLLKLDLHGNTLYISNTEA